MLLLLLGHVTGDDVISRVHTLGHIQCSSIRVTCSALLRNSSRRGYIYIERAGAGSRKHSLLPQEFTDHIITSFSAPRCTIMGCRESRSAPKYNVLASERRRKDQYEGSATTAASTVVQSSTQSSPRSAVTAAPSTSTPLTSFTLPVSSSSAPPPPSVSSRLANESRERRASPCWVLV